MLAAGVGVCVPARPAAGSRRTTPLPMPARSAPWPMRPTSSRIWCSCVAGLLGLRAVARQHALPARAAWTVAFCRHRAGERGLGLVPLRAWRRHVAMGSAADDGRLHGSAAAVLAIPFGERASRRILVPAVIAGIGSVIAWRLTGDLRPYSWCSSRRCSLIGAIVVLGPMTRARIAAPCCPRWRCTRSRRASSWRMPGCSRRPPASSAATR